MSQGAEVLRFPVSLLCSKTDAVSFYANLGCKWTHITNEYMLHFTAVCVTLSCML